MRGLVDIVQEHLPLARARELTAGETATGAHRAWAELTRSGKLTALDFEKLKNGDYVMAAPVPGGPIKISAEPLPTETTFTPYVFKAEVRRVGSWRFWWAVFGRLDGRDGEWQEVGRID